jgi:type IV pilus assembly protein PilB
MALTDEQLIDAGLRAGLIEPNKIDAIRHAARRQRKAVLAMVLATYRFPVTALYRAVAEIHSLRYLQKGAWTINSETVKKLPISLLTRKLLLPIEYQGKTGLLITDPTDQVTIDNARRLLRVPVSLYMTDPVTLRFEQQSALPASPMTTGVVEETDVVSLLDSFCEKPTYIVLRTFI